MVGLTNSDEDLFSFDLLGLLSISESNHLIFRDERGETRDVLDFVLLKISLIDAIESLDVGISLVLECEPVKIWRADLWETILLGVMDGLGN